METFKRIYLLNVLILFFLSFIAIFSIFYFNEFHYNIGRSAITFGSLILFLVCLFLSIAKEEYISFLLPLVLLGFPSAINNVFGGVYLDSKDLEVLFPLIMYLDVYFSVLLLWKFSKQKQLHLKRFSLWINIFTLLFLLSTCINIVLHDKPQYTMLLLASTYPVRICLLLQLFLSNFIINYRKLILGFSICIFFLLVESSFFTLVSGKDFASGTLGSNTFGNITGQVIIFLIFSIYIGLVSKKSIPIILIAIVLSFMIVLATQTRMALLCIMIMLVFVIFPKLKMKWKVTFLSIVLIFSLGIVYWGFNNEKYNVGLILENISFDTIGGEHFGLFTISKGTTTNSLITRLELWKTSLDMFHSNVLWGNGFGLFNVEKYKYGFEESIIIDSHNGYFFLLSQLGVVGILWVYLLYLYPVKLFFTTKDNFLKLVCMINVGMAICDLSNAGIYKPQVLSILLFNVLMANLIVWNNIKIKIVNK